MKKIYLFSALAAAAALSAGCSKIEPADNSAVTGEMRNINLVTSVETGATKSQWIDHEGISWQQSDIDKMGFVSNIGEVGNSRAITIEEGTGKASFGIATGAASTKIFTFYPYRAGVVAYNAEEGQFTIPYDIADVQAQPAAGACSLDLMPMRSAGVVDAIEGYYERNNPMSLVGSLVRFLIYTDNEAYSSENVISVEMTASEGTMLNGRCVLTGSWDTEAVVGAFTGGVNTAKVRLQSDYILTGVKDVNSAKGVYMIVAPAVSQGCTYVVTTDKAEYKFVSAAERTFAANTIHNIVLNLASEKAERKESSGEVTHTLVWNKDNGEKGMDIPSAKWQGEFGATTVTFDDVQVADMGNVSFDIVDAENNPINWLHAEWVNTNDYNLRIIADRHPDNSGWRNGFVYIKYRGLRSTTCMRINQEPGNGIPFIVPALKQNRDTEILAAGETVESAATLSLEVNGQPVDDVAPYVQYVKLSCVSVDTGAAEVTAVGSEIKIVFPENPYGSKVKYTLKASTDDGEATLRFTQSEGEGGAAKPKLSYNLQITVDAPAPGGAWNTSDLGERVRVYNIKDASGKAFPIPLELDEETVAQLISQIFVFGEVEESDKTSGDGTTGDNTFVTIYPRLQEGDSLYINFHLATNETGQRRYAKVIAYDADGTPAYTWVIHQDPK